MENLLLLGVPILKHISVFYTTIISVDFSQYEIFHAKVCNYWQRRYNYWYMVYLANKAAALPMITDTEIGSA